MKRTAMPQRTKPLARRTGLKSRSQLPRASTSVAQLRNAAAPRSGTAPKRLCPASAKPPGGEFTPAVKLAVRARAGEGDPEQARCESCGRFLGLNGGQVQHRVARMSGGRGRKAPWWIRAAVNAALLCGTPLWGCHWLAEKRSKDMGPEGAGWWLKSCQNPALVPVIVRGTGMPVYLTRAGGYSAEPDLGGAA